MVDQEFPGKVLLAEANQWPADVVDYFGDESAPRVPHVLQLPADAADVHGGPPGGGAADPRDHGPAPRHSPTGPGASSSEPRRADLEMVTDEERDHVRGVRQGPAG
ncbi:MAG: hypothetical protein R2711_19335 [Acidimicrobiales bacterium]